VPPDELHTPHTHRVQQTAVAASCITALHCMHAASAN
jgi:hypothetical protein